MSAESPVQASWFYIDSNEKVKLNWFLYEYACSLYVHINRSRKKALAKWKAQRDEEQIAEFCAYFSKRMRQSILDKLAGRTEETIGDEEYICDYCHTNTHRDNVAILEVAESAWDELLDSCVACPNRCISERYAHCEFFDRMESGGYFT
jgi:uncharacterized Fe-S radical SAM superfamily protein PflX